jgi:hypothetical protein
MARYLRTLRAVLNGWVILSMLLGGMPTPRAAAAPAGSRNVATGTLTPCQ